MKNIEVLQTDYLIGNKSVSISIHKPTGQIYYVFNNKGIVHDLFLNIFDLMNESPVISFNSESDLEDYEDSEGFTSILI